jgi:hypothetical protein
MTQSLTKVGRTIRTGTFTAMLALTGVTAVTASAATAPAWDRQAGEATVDDVINRQAAGLGYAVAPQPGPYASAPRGRRIEAPGVTRKDFQDIK